MSTPRSIAVIHMNQIGDFCFSLPLLANLRKAHPKAKIVSIIPRSLMELPEGLSFIDKVIVRSRGTAAWLRLVTEVREHRFDWLFCLPRSESALALTALSRARRRFGFKRLPWDLGLTDSFELEGHHGWPNYRKFLKHLKLPVTKNDYVGLLAADSDPGVHLPARPFVVVSPGASKRRDGKAWSIAGFAQVMTLLHKSNELSFVLVGSPDNSSFNSSLLEELGRLDPATKEATLDLTGSMGLGSLCGLLRKCRLFLGIDSGVMHLASAIDRPTVGIFGPTDPVWVAPQNKNSMVVRRDDLDCIPCYMKLCKNRDCLEKLDPSMVLAACQKLLKINLETKL